MCLRLWWYRAVSLLKRNSQLRRTLCKVFVACVNFGFCTRFNSCNEIFVYKQLLLFPVTVTGQYIFGKRWCQMWRAAICLVRMTYEFPSGRSFSPCLFRICVTIVVSCKFSFFPLVPSTWLAGKIFLQMTCNVSTFHWMECRQLCTANLNNCFLLAARRIWQKIMLWKRAHDCQSYFCMCSV